LIVTVDSFLERKREVFHLSGDFSVDRDDDTAGRPPSQPSLLTSIRGLDYPHFVMGGIDSELFRKEYRGVLKSKSLILSPQKEENR
jgi:hypothetical protein